MSYVRRDESGLIVGLYIREQPGMAEEFVKDAKLDAKPYTQKDYSEAIQIELDKKARALGYDSIFTAVTYANEPGVPKFQQEGQALSRWRSISWAYAYDKLDQVENGLISKPTIEEFIAGMPGYE